MQVEKRTMNWLPRASAYDEATAARAKRKERNTEFLSASASLATSLGELRTAVATEQASISSRIALKRITESSVNKTA